MSNFKYKIYISMAVAWMVIIFVNSSLNGDSSAGFSASIVIFITRMLHILGDSNFINKFVSAVESYGFHLFLRKTAHFVEFGILGVLYTIGLGVFKNLRSSHFKRTFIALGLAIVYAITDEIHQLFVAGRVCSAVDVMIDSLGALSFSMIFVLIIRQKEIRVVREKIQPSD